MGLSHDGCLMLAMNLDFVSSQINQHPFNLKSAVLLRIKKGVRTFLSAQNDPGKVPVGADSKVRSPFLRSSIR